MKKLMVLSFVVLTMLSCRNKESNRANSDASVQEVAQEKVITLDLGCYIFDDNKNRVALEITEIGAEVKGNLTYAFTEKDQNHGTFIGHLKDGILLANYTFQSEGMESVRQVAFQVHKDMLIEGYGDLSADGTTFKDVKNLSFTSSMPLIKADCDDQKSACLFDNGKAYSELEQKCLTLASLDTRLNPLKNGAKTDGEQAYLVFSSDNTKAEIFLPKSNKGMVMEKSSEGNWAFKNYTLTAWKGYVLQEKGVAIYGG